MKHNSVISRQKQRNEITTLTGIVLSRVRDMDYHGGAVVMYGAWEFFVNGLPVNYWIYERIPSKFGPDFYTEKIKIEQSVMEVPV